MNEIVSGRSHHIHEAINGEVVDAGGAGGWGVGKPSVQAGFQQPQCRLTEPKLAHKVIFTAVCVAGPLFLDRLSVQRDWG